MEIISHRGFWLETGEKNTRAAFVRSFAEGFGTETDIRDSAGNLVISHDPAGPNAMRLDEMLALRRGSSARLPLALNIKADGLAPRLKETLRNCNPESYFFFDMSVPEMVRYVRDGLPVYTRLSDVETSPVLLDASTGIWLDSFSDDAWIDERLLTDVLRRGKPVCLVSPELHGREPTRLWNVLLKTPALVRSALLTLCTDRPDKAKEFFA